MEKTATIMTMMMRMAMLIHDSTIYSGMKDNEDGNIDLIFHDLFRDGKRQLMPLSPSFSEPHLPRC